MKDGLRCTRILRDEALGISAVALVLNDLDRNLMDLAVPRSAWLTETFATLLLAAR